MRRTGGIQVSRKKYNGQICAFDGCENPAKQVDYCTTHRTQFLRTGKMWDIGTSRNGKGFGEWREWKINSQGYIGRERGKKDSQYPYESELQHRHVMEQYLGRKLVPGENVHHINGDKADNRIENLELWNTAQPSGQRVEDKVAWAKEILDLYKDYRQPE